MEDYVKQKLKNLIMSGSCVELIKETMESYPGSLDEQVDEKGSTWLILAVKSGLARVVELMILRKADLNKADFDGNTPLHHAFLNNFKSCIEQLMLAGADECAENHKGQRPWELIAVRDF